MSSAVRRNLSLFVSENAPLLVFTSVYLLTCLVGALLMLIDYRPFVLLYEIFSGTSAPDPVGSQRQTAVVLLLASPMLLWVGFLATTSLITGSTLIGERPHVNAPELIKRDAPTYRWRYVVVFLLLAAVALASLGRFDAFSNLGAWLNYAAWIDARWQLFRDMSFVEFVNLYTLVPLSAGLVVITTRAASFRSQLLRWTPALIAVGLSLALFQKKAAIIAILIILAVWAIDASRRNSAFVRRGIALSSIVLAVLYAGMVVVPTYNAAVSVVRTEQRDRPVRITPLPSATTQPTAGGPSASQEPVSSPLEGLDPTTGVLLYSLLSSVTRTSAPALYYPIVYPAVHPYYGLDLGQDIICSPKLGCENHGMPDDNLVVWDYMNPTFHGGSVAAPFQFALYSQVGLLGALLGSLVVGALLAFLWRVARSALVSPPLSSLLGAIVLLLSLNLALDSVRNSTVVSYGALWGILFVAVVALLGKTGSFGVRASPSGQQLR